MAGIAPRPSRLTVQDFMYRGHKRLGLFFSAQPLRLCLCLALIATLLLLLPALLAHVAFIKDTKTGEWPWVGFWQRWNWSLMYVVILPLIFSGAAALSQACLTIFEGLTVPTSPDGTPVVIKRDKSPAFNFTEEISKQIAHSAMYVFWVVLFVTVVLTIADTFELFAGFYKRLTHVSYRFSDLDWSVAFSLDPGRFYFYGFPQRGAWSNIVFDLLAYAAQTLVIFLGFFWIGKYWITLNSFATQLIDETIEFEFQPWWEDPLHRMGLMKVGRLFNGFLGIAVLFQLYVLGHRLQLIERSGWSLVDYFKKIKAAPTNPVLLWQCRAFNTCTPGMWLLLIFVLLPVVVIAWVPLTRFRRYINRIWQEKFDSLRAKLDKYPEGSPERKAVLKEWEDVNDANIWPNGDFWGWLFLVLMFVLTAAAWFPPGLGYLVFGGGVTLLIKFVTSLLPKSKAS